MEMELDTHLNSDEKTKKTNRRDLLRNKGRKIEQVEEYSTDENTYIDIPISKLIENPYQPRLEMNRNKLLEMAASIKTEGLIQPIGVTKRDDLYIIRFGHRRVEAHRILGLKTIKAVVEKDVDNATLRTQAIIENIQKEDMHPLHLSIALNEGLNDGHYKSQSDIVNAIGKEKTYVSKIINLISLPEEIKKDILKNKTIKSATSLDIIRRIGESNKIKEVYHWYTNRTPLPTEQELKVKIASLADNKTIEKYEIKHTKNGATIKLPKLTEAQKEELDSFIKKLIND